MCTVSDKLKLCTCKTENVKRLKHYWTLKRPTEKTHWVVGEMILPANIGETADKINQNTILSQLNNGNCFDFELQHQENDTLELHFTYKVDPEKYLTLPYNGDFLVYSFKFKKGEWKKSDYDPFEIDFNEVQKGKIISPFSKQKN